VIIKPEHHMAMPGWCLIEVPFDVLKAQRTSFVTIQPGHHSAMPGWCPTEVPFDTLKVQRTSFIIKNVRQKFLLMP
jgi:hypothetical protein